jgi:hypothetical protein
MQAKKKILSLELFDPENMASLSAEDVGELIG